MAAEYPNRNEPIFTLIASLAINGVNIVLKKPQMEQSARPDICLDGCVNIEFLDGLIKYLYGIED